MVELGKSAVEYTHFYRMDASLTEVDKTFDRNCVVTSLMRCFFPSFQLKHRSVEEVLRLLRDLVNQGTLILYAQICISILEADSIENALLAIG